MTKSAKDRALTIGEFEQFKVSDFEPFRQDFYDFKIEMQDFKQEMYEFREEMYAFREEMYEFREEMYAFREEMYAFREEMYKFKKEVTVRIVNIERILDNIQENMYTKKEHERDMRLMDEMMTEVRAARRERILATEQRLRMDDQLHDHEKRITSLEAR